MAALHDGSPVTPSPRMMIDGSPGTPPSPPLLRPKPRNFNMVFLADQRKKQTTPEAIEAQRVEKVRILMSMR
ncbi:hypothetical protein RIF29_29042 [Crotalaria pallida]|uniref:Uncharacterized protein n=1 Tax=Crotalaria pallida TaxID=3830 RepID=A0AAN9EDY4_CROPI